MIIVSQKRDKIINFDNVIEISAEGFNNSRIVCLTNASLCIPIGMYKTEERAKEVLQEIIKENFGRMLIQYKYPTKPNKKIDDAEFIKKMDRDFGIVASDFDMEIKSLPDNMVYYMPEE